MRARLGKLIKRPELVFALVMLLFGVLSATLLPILQAPDENQHFQIEYAEFSSRSIPDGAALSKGVVLHDQSILAAVRNHAYSSLFTTKIPKQYNTLGLNVGSYVFDGKTRSSIFDIMHLPQALGVLFGRFVYPSLGVMVLMGRLFNLAVYIAVLYLIIKRIRYGKWVLVFVACLPIMAQQAASLSYDSINLLAIFAWFAFIINLSTQKSPFTKKQVAVGMLLSLLLFLTKTNNLLLLLLLLGMPAHLIVKTKPFITIRTSKYWNGFKYLAVLVAGLVLSAASYVMGRIILAGEAFHPLRLTHVLINTFFWGHEGDLTLIDTTVNGMVGEFSDFYYHLPVWAVCIAFAVLVISMLHEKLPDVSKRLALVSGITFLGSVLLVTVALYYGWAVLPVRLGPNAQVADGIQGRYFTPLLILLFPVFAYLQKHLKVTVKDEATLPRLVTGVTTFLLVCYVIQTWHFFWR